MLYGDLRAHNRWMPIMLIKYCRNIVTHAICGDKKKGACMLREVDVFVQERAGLMHVCVCACVCIILFVLQRDSLDSVNG